MMSDQPATATAVPLVRYVQRSRAKGAKLPPGTVCCTRPGFYQNPFRVTKACDAALAVALFVERSAGFATGSADCRRDVMTARLEILARDHRARTGEPLPLACWCAVGQPCHVQDALIPWVNATEQPVEVRQ